MTAEERETLTNLGLCLAMALLGGLILGFVLDLVTGP